jgi:hypothetical protein
MTLKWMVERLHIFGFPGPPQVGCPNQDLLFANRGSGVQGQRVNFSVAKCNPISSENLSGEKVLFALAGATC